MIIDQIAYDVLKEVAFVLVGKAQENSVSLCKDPDSITRFLTRELHEVKSAVSALCQKDLYAAVDLLDRGIGVLGKELQEISKNKSNKYSEASALAVSVVTSSVDDNSLVNESAYRDIMETYFRPANLKAVEAFNNFELTVKDKLLACKIQLTCTFLLHREDRPQVLASLVVHILNKFYDFSRSKLKRAIKIQTAGAVKKATTKKLLKSRYMGDMEFYHSFILLVWNTLNVLEEHCQRYLLHYVGNESEEVLKISEPSEKTEVAESTAAEIKRKPSIEDVYMALDTVLTDDFSLSDPNVLEAQNMIKELHLSTLDETLGANEDKQVLTVEEAGQQTINAMRHLAVNFEIDTWLMIWGNPDPSLSNGKSFLSLSAEEKLELGTAQGILSGSSLQRNIKYLKTLNEIASIIEPLERKLSALGTAAETEEGRQSRTGYILRWTAYIAKEKLSHIFGVIGVNGLERYILLRLFLVVEEKLVGKYSADAKKSSSNKNSLSSEDEQASSESLNTSFTLENQQESLAYSEKHIQHKERRLNLKVLKIRRKQKKAKCDVKIIITRPSSDSSSSSSSSSSVQIQNAKPKKFFSRKKFRILKKPSRKVGKKSFEKDEAVTWEDYENDLLKDLEAKQQLTNKETDV